MKPTTISKLKGSKHIVNWGKLAKYEDVVKNVENYYIRHSKTQSVTLVCNDISFLTISLELQYKLFDIVKQSLYSTLASRPSNITGILCETYDEAKEVEQEILKGYEWALLKI